MKKDLEMRVNAIHWFGTMEYGTTQLTSSE